MIKKLTYNDVEQLAKQAAPMVREYGNKIYCVPRGGIFAGFALRLADKILQIVDDPEHADVIVDDLVASGVTKQRYAERHPKKPFITLVNRPKDWIVFPWESGCNMSGIEDHFVKLIQYCGDDPNREGLIDTPARMTKAWQFWCSGYEQNPADVLKHFNDGAEGYDNMVTVKGIPFYSKCEHHLADIFGTATIAYIPDKKIVGLSKLSRVLDIFARRLQVQERLTNQVADAIQENLNPSGVGVILKARHLCMESRGICKQGHFTITTALRGVFKTHSEVRTEFLEIAKNDNNDN